MSVRKRKWKNPRGKTRKAWVVDYVDGDGQRRNKNFRHRCDADAYADRIYANRVNAELHALNGTRLPEDESDIVFGMIEIRRLIGRSPKEVSYLLHKTTLLDGCVKRVSHKITIGSRSRLRNLAITTLADKWIR
jgi:hypothetical protein